MRQLWVAFIFFGLSVQAASVVLSPNNFKALTAKGTWFIEFFSPHCPACQQFAPTWKKLADENENMLKDNVHFGTVDCFAFGDLCSEHNIAKYPSIQSFKQGDMVDAFQGDRQWDTLVAYVAEHTLAAESQPQTETATGPNPSGKSVDLDRDSLTAITANHDRPWFIKFYSPTCPHCQVLAPTWEKMAKELQHQVDVGEHVSGIELAQHMEEDEVALVYLYNNEKDAPSDLLQDIAKTFVNGIKFYTSDDESAIRQYRLGPSDLPTALIVKDGRQVMYPSRDFSNIPKVRESFLKWIQVEKFPLVSHIGVMNAQEILNGDRVVILAVINDDDKTNTEKFRKMAETWMSHDRKQRNKNYRLLFAQLDGVGYTNQAQNVYGVSKDDMPAILIVDPANNQYFKEDQQHKKLSMDNPKILSQMLESISAGLATGISTLAAHEKAGLRIQEGLNLAQSHWRLSCISFLILGLLFYKFMGRKKVRPHILPLKQQPSAIEHND
ncbi:hypothetical protein DFQ28_008435 [Apophysomyces sp. BC1034]|nr:hypothetical protein DFQ30_004825 [Apophysomyces sp. BC1015]KAG0171816.1 hypothetical protein DFQ29_008666 [Apophysomyces sp. BC1021]KAG0186026.1 hypothetical protein DFQ28_008435 [Apophysomyces sp. BC1034]